jgi:hypothetical protein
MNSSEEHLAIAFNSNELSYISLNNIFDNLKGNILPKEEIICDGFHKGPVNIIKKLDHYNGRCIAKTNNNNLFFN